MDVPYDLISEAALKAMLEEFVLREGTDYGHEDYSLQDKTAQVRSQLESGKIKVVYSEDDETFDLVRVK